VGLARRRRIGKKMALVHISTTVGTTATLICTIQTGLGSVPVQINNQNAQPIFIGDSTITAAGAGRGTRIASNANFQVWAHSGDNLYAISAAGTSAGDVSIIYSGQ
jgi:hypothetical protein